MRLKNFNPTSDFKAAKRSGSDAFKSNRVYLAPLLKWIFAERSDDKINWREHFDRFHALREETRHQKESEQILDKAETAFTINRGMSLVFGQLDRQAHVGLPPDFKGLKEVESQSRLIQAFEEVKTLLRDEWSRLTKKNGE